MIVIQIAGHLGADPETRFTPSGQKVITFRVATNIRRGSKEKTVWWKVTVWGDRFDRKLQYLKKGSAIFVLGDMGIPDIYQDRNGNPQTSFEIIAEYIGFNPFGGGKGDKEGQGQDAHPESEDDDSAPGSSPYSGNARSSARAQPAQVGMMPGALTNQGSFDDDDIPF